MSSTIARVATVLATICLASAAVAKTARAPAAATVAAPAPAVPVQDCSTFYDDYKIRGFGWGSGPGSSVGFGAFEGALPRYPPNSFPNWYGDCVNWGHYSATGSPRW